VTSHLLLDAKVLIAMTHPEHASHNMVQTWWMSEQPGIATCPITQGSVVRFYARLEGAAGAQSAISALGGLASKSYHRFWPDDLQYTILPLEGLRGHNQVTDLYLVALAQSKGTMLVTLDRALAAWHPSSCLFLG